VDDEGMMANVVGETASAIEAVNAIGIQHPMFVAASRKQGFGA
jgi:hypothetical protein